MTNWFAPGAGITAVFSFWRDGDTLRVFDIMHLDCSPSEAREYMAQDHDFPEVCLRVYSSSN